MKAKPLILLIYALALIAFSAYLLRDAYMFVKEGQCGNTFSFFILGWLWLIWLVLITWYTGRNKIQGTFFLVCISVLVALLAGEIILRITGINQSSIEARSGIYVSPYHSHCLDLFYEYTHNGDFYLESPEFKYKRTSNSLGITGPEPALKKDSNEFRILAMGDSYTDGDGAHYDSSYVSFLKRMLAAKYPCQKFSFINAGVCGSDPFFNYIHLQKKFLAYKPDLVLVNISSGDIIADQMVRGGMERFANGQKTVYRKAPWWEPIYAASFLFRLFARNVKHVDLLLLTPQDYVNQKTYLDTTNADLMNRFNELGEKHNFKTVFMLRPFLWETKTNKYDYDFTVIQKTARGHKNLVWFDMMPEYTRLIKQSEKPADAFFWPQNGHHNAGGYELMATAALPCVEPNLTPCPGAK